MPRSEPRKSPSYLSPENSHSKMKPHPRTTGVKPRTKSFLPAAMLKPSALKPWHPSLPPHALARKPKPPAEPVVLRESIIRGTETFRRTEPPPKETEILRRSEPGRKPDHPSKEKETIRRKKDPPPRRIMRNFANKNRLPHRGNINLRKTNFRRRPGRRKKIYRPRRRNISDRKFFNFRMTSTLSKKCHLIMAAIHLRRARPPPTHIPALIAVRFPAIRRN